MAIYVITHKYLQEKVPTQGYQYLYVGACKRTEDQSGYFYDDAGDNISSKNPNYCELTGLYWIWKNSKEEYVGLAHYRRFFTHNSFSSSPRFYYSTGEMNELLKKYDLIVAEKLYVAAPNLYENYDQYHYGKDLDTLRNVLANVSPDYLEAYDELFSRNYYSPCNMFYAKKNVIDDYCSWLFPLMDAYEGNVDVSGYNTQQARIFGFVAERLFNVWMIKNKVRVKELPMIQTDCSYKHRIRLKLDKIFKRALREKAVYEK